jgi:hypothetical protein
MTPLDIQTSFESGVTYGYLKAVNPDECALLSPTLMGADPKAFAPWDGGRIPGRF